MSAEPPLIDYEDLAQEAMRGVVRSVLRQTAKSGLPGDHHFFISFDTSVDGVTLSKRLREKYKNEMTIVLQHRFWDLHVADDHFEVKLTFDGIPERLRVPFEAIKVFFDPSVRYGLQFEDGGDNVDGQQPPLSDITDVPSRSADAPKTAGGRARRPYAAERMPKSSGDNSSGAVPQAGPSANESGGTDGKSKTAASADRQNVAPDEETVTAEIEENGSAEIVSLDAFRNKS